MAPSNVTFDPSFLRERTVRRRIAAITIACTVAGTAFALLAPKWYRSVLTVVPAKSQRGGGGLSTLLGGDAAGLAAGFLDGATAAADGSRIAAVLQSVAVTDAVIEKFDLKARYGETYQENTRDELWRHCDVRVLAKPQLVQLSCEDKDPKFVQQLLTFFADFGNAAFRRVSVSSASEEVRYLEKRVADLRLLADESAARMREFQETHRIIDLDTQAKAVVGAMAALNAQKIGKQLELDYARTFSGRDEPALRQLRSQLSVMGERLRDLEESPEPPPAPETERSASPAKRTNGMFPAALEVPKLRAEFEKRYRDRRVAEATLIFALERLEAARANEARDVSTFLVLDPPALPTRKSRPKRVLVIGIAALLGLAGALALETWRARAVTLSSGSRGPAPLKARPAEQGLTGTSRG